MRAIVIAATAGMVVAVKADGRELDVPRAAEAFFGRVVATAPRGATRAELYVGDRLVAARRVRRSRVVLVVPRKPGRYDLRLRFERGRRLLRRQESLGAWLLPRSAARARRERVRDARLSRSLAELGSRFHGWAGIWVHDVSTGRTAGWNSDASFPAASTVKLAVLIAALDRFGPRPERSSAWRDIRDLAVWSSNRATNRLLVRLGGSESGGARIAETVLYRVGARSSTFTGFYRIGTADVPRPLPLLTYRRTTAHDLGRILFELHAAAVGNGLSQRRTGLSRHEARAGLALLLSSDPRGDNVGLFRPAVGRRLPMAQKHGWTTSVRHSAAIVYRPAGPRIVVLLTYRPKLRVADAHALGRQLIRALGR